MYRYDDYDGAMALEKEFDDKSKEICMEESGGVADDVYSDTITDEQMKIIQERIAGLASEMGVDKWGSAENGVEKIEMPSKKYPNHYFNVGYFRSSYNDGGINTILRNTLGIDLYYIFGAMDEQYHVRPDWKECRDRAKDVLKRYRAFIKEYGDVKVMSVDALPGAIRFADGNIKEAMESVPKGKDGAMTVFKEKMAEYRKSKYYPEHHSFGCRDGDFFLKDGINVKAIVPGIGILGDPVMYLVYEHVYDKNDPDTANGKNWYEAALEIIIETCSYVIRKKEPSKYILHWSG